MHIECARTRDRMLHSPLCRARRSRKMSVLGIDLGNESGVIAQALRGGVDIILNEGSKRLSP
jgi:molecular chaperone DnaK (HSP70)